VQKRWIIRKHDAEAINKLAAELGVLPLIAALLIARGHDTSAKAKAFLNPSLDQLHDPLLLKGMGEAIARIKEAISRKEKILIWGDYDVDGTTGTALLRKLLQLLGTESSFHCPNRFTEGYGVNIPELEKARERGVSLVITVDCGIRSFEPVEWAAKNGLDVIITDHHLSDEARGVPPAVAVIDPNQAGCPYPDKKLAGVGVAFKLAHALLRDAGREDEIGQFLKIAAIGTVADVVDLTGENRVIVSLGLRDLTKTDNWGLKALMEVADCRSDMTSYHIGFRIGPRINAAGRMDVAKHVVELLETQDFGEARRLAEMLDSRNRERQKVQQQITALALEQAAAVDGQSFVVVSGQGWHKGVIGLAASRIAERLFRPTLVITINDGIGHGSARSITGFHVLEALDCAADLFDQYGGHAAAAGVTIREARLEELKLRLNGHASAAFANSELTPTLHIDALLRSRSLNLQLVEQLSAFEPFGAGNPKPVFVTRGLKIVDQFVMKEKHLKLRLVDEDGRTFEALWWDGVEKSQGQTLKVNSCIELAYVLEANTWQGNTRLQLVVEDLRVDN
jgi:single-stranded-DNA-specific exonuclease